MLNNRVNIQNLSLSYKDKKILDNLNLQVKEKEIIGIQGISGCGKSSLIHCICKIIPTLINGNITGDIYIDDENMDDISIEQIPKKIGVVMQNPVTQLFFSTLEDEIAFTMENLCFEKSEILKRIDESLELIDMVEYRNCDPQKLSGGQQQLLVLACVLATRPQILLLDEAFSQIDQGHKNKIIPIIKDYAQKGNTVIMIDHQRENLNICTRILTLEKGNFIGNNL